ncbi:glycopeptide, partial [Pholiota conissans]
MFSFKTAFLTGLAAIAITTNAEIHVVHFVNNCGFGTPTLIQGGTVLSTGGDFISDGPLIAAIAYLQTGTCGSNGENCTLIETSLINPRSPGSGSGSDISLIPPHSFSVASGFWYFNGCEGSGADCTNPDCPTASHHPNDGLLQVVCEENNVNLNITFC